MSAHMLRTIESSLTTVINKSIFAPGFRHLGHIIQYFAIYGKIPEK